MSPQLNFSHSNALTHLLLTISAIKPLTCISCSCLYSSSLFFELFQHNIHYILLRSFSLPLSSSSRLLDHSVLYCPLNCSKALSCPAHVLHRHVEMPQCCTQGTSDLPHLFTGWYFQLEQRKILIVCGFCLSLAVLQQLQRSRKICPWCFLGFHASVCP